MFERLGRVPQLFDIGSQGRFTFHGLLTKAVGVRLLLFELGFNADQALLQHFGGLNQLASVTRDISQKFTDGRFCLAGILQGLPGLIEFRT